MNTFNEFGLLPSLEKTLKDKSFKRPTEIQTKAIPLMMDRESVVGVAETGSGKTLAYALPLLNLLKTLENDGKPVQTDSCPRAIVMVPTRELGEQISKVFKIFTHDTRLRVRPALGGMAMEQAKDNLEKYNILLEASDFNKDPLLWINLVKYSRLIGVDSYASSTLRKMSAWVDPKILEELQLQVL